MSAIGGSMRATAWPWQAGAGLRGIGLALALGQVLALAVSLEFLFQPYVWRHWPLDEVLSSGSLVWRDRAWVALLTTLAGWGALQATRDSVVAAKVLAYSSAVILAAWLAERSLQWTGSWGAAIDDIDLRLRVLRWSALALAVGGWLAAWRHSLRADEALHRAQLQGMSMQQQLAEVRAQALQAQIEPHFLFNTLATARRLGDTDPERGQRLLTHLHDFVHLAGSAAPSATQWRLQDELELVRAYLAVFELRMEGRLRSQLHVVQAALQLPVPPLALATLVENAVKHGITPSTTGGAVQVSAAFEELTASRRLVLEVADTGVGWGNGLSAPGSGLGLANTRRRLMQLYGTAGELTLAGNLPQGARAILRIPAGPA